MSSLIEEVWEEAFLDLVSEVVENSYPQVLSHMRDELPNECVGLIWMDGQVQRLLNQARSPERFSISQPQLAERLAEMDESNVLVCIYHSHPNGDIRLSESDKRSLRAQWEKDLVIPWLVVTETEVTIWYIRDDDREIFAWRHLKTPQMSEPHD